MKKFDCAVTLGVVHVVVEAEEDWAAANYAIEKVANMISRGEITLDYDCDEAVEVE